MANKNNDLKIHLDSLLNSYSVKDITNLFTTLDQRLISLHERSAEDFLKLNDSYKHIYKQSDEMVKSILQIIYEFSNHKNDNLYYILNVLYEKLKVQREVLEYKIIVISDQLEKLINQIRHVFFPIKNYNQNLISLKYLIANFKVSLSYKSEELNMLESSYLYIEKHIDTIKTFSENIAVTLNQFSKNVKNTQKELENLTKISEINIDDLLSNIKSNLTIIERKSLENENIIPSIKEGINKIQHSNSEIVKKIQYQDIIKQKMDHIQETHKDLIHELGEFNDSQKAQDQLNEKVKCFLKIRDISGLQAAQLMQANKEYQSAMEVITDNFILIGDNIQEITEKSEEMYSFGKVDYNKMFENLDSYIHSADVYLKDYHNQMDRLEKETTNIHKQFLEIGFTINNHRKYTQDLEKSLKQYNLFINQRVYDEPEFENANQQFKDLLLEIEANKNKLNAFFDQMIMLKSNIEGFANKTDNTLLGVTDLTEFKGILDALKKKGQNIENTLKQNKNYSNSIIDNIKASFSNINYYDYFENIIMEIITDLNTVNLKLKLHKDHHELSMEDNLEILKQYYTMETEHKIHDKVTKGFKDNLNFDIKEDDEIEFF